MTHLPPVSPRTDTRFPHPAFFRAQTARTNGRYDALVCSFRILAISRNMPMNNATTPLIHLTDISKVFYADEVETHALAGVHFDIGKGEYVSISGPSGCGKSTLLAILGLLDPASAGAYTLNGTPVQEIGRASCRERVCQSVFI